MKSKLLIIFFVITAGLIYILFANRATNPNLPFLRPSHELSYTGSIGSGDKVEKGISTFKNNYKKLESVSLGWYNLDSDNTITRDDSVSEEVEADTIAFAKQNGIKALFGVSDHGEAEKADDILTDEEVQEENISNILSIIDDKGYDGVIIDYEDMKNEQEEDFTNYMRKLSNKIHSSGKLLGISIPVETKGRVSHGINIVDVSKIVDSMHMNIYEQHGEGTVPGPIASSDWTNKIIENAIAQGVKPNKIVLGTAHSGHDWIVEPREEFFKDMSTYETLNLLSKTNATVIWDEEKQANYFGYTDNEGRRHAVWLEDAKSFQSKIDLAKAYQLKGIFIWYLSGEDPQIWQTSF
jgi:spore germination protein YaaH